MKKDTNNNNFNSFSYTSAFFILIGLALVGLVIGGAISVVILVYMKGADINNLESALRDPANANAARLIQVINVVVSMLFPSLLVARMVSKRPLRLLGFKKEVSWKQVGLVILIVFASILVAGALGYLNKILPFLQDMKAEFDRLEKNYTEQVALMVDFKSFGGYLFSLFIMAFLPALCEETLFRGGLQNLLTKATHKPWLAIILVSILFSLVHFSVFGFLPRMFLGIVLGAIFHYTSSLWLCIAAHFLNNALAVTSMYVLSLQGKDIKEVMSQETPYYLGLISLPVLIILLITLKKTARRDQIALENHY
jgi:membrane protease YdiL (CAAX protease family)